jgi:hypothetical protein
MSDRHGNVTNFINDIRHIKHFFLNITLMSHISVFVTGTQIVTSCLIVSSSLTASVTYGNISVECTNSVSENYSL